ncbi:sulfite exporter TauE/SafE family protein [Rhodospirillaceae bacterium SYSU D60014]|uniref:sulfite exporter TauE/SafE family protein n=1 Tax=Virgifigura deserti TaxID=2268457 RepID=UPI000E671D21
MTDLTLIQILVGMAAFFFGGLVKGVIGVTLPLIALSILVTVVPVPTAVGLQAIPILAANLWQGADPAQIRPTLKRFWSLLAALVIGLVVGTGLLVEIEARPLYAIVGTLISAMALIQALSPDFSIAPRWERWASPAVGVVAGLLGGLVASFGPPIAIYLAALRLPKDLFISSLGIAYFSAGLPLTLLLLARGVLDATLLWLSIVACLPVFAGMFLGRRLRNRIDQALFRNLVLVGLFLVGLNLIRRAIW